MLVSLEALAFAVGLAVIGSSLWLWHFGKKENSECLRISAIALLVVALLSQGCLVYHIAKYHFEGAAEYAYPHHEMSAAMMGMMKGDMMGGGMMMGQDKKDGAQAAKPLPQGTAEKASDKAEHEAHH